MLWKRSDRSLQRNCMIVDEGIHRQYKVVVGKCERRVKRIRRGEGKEPKEMDPFSFMMTSLSCVQKSRDVVMTFLLYSHGAVDGLGRSWEQGFGRVFEQGQRSITRQTGWGSNLCCCWSGAPSWERAQG